MFVHVLAQLYHVEHKDQMEAYSYIYLLQSNSSQAEMICNKYKLDRISVGIFQDNEVMKV